MGIGEYYIPLAAYLGCFVIGFLTIFVKTELGLMYLVIFLPLQNIMQKMHRFPLGNQFIDILVVFLILGWLIRGRNEKGGLFEKTPLNFLLLSYIVITFVSLLWGFFYLDQPIDFDNSRFKDWKNLALLPILYFITVNNTRDPKWMKIILVVTLFSILLTDWFFYKEFRWFKQWHYSHDMRVGGPFYYLGPNELGAFFAQYGVLTIGLLVFARTNLNRILVGLVFLANLYCLIYSFSRAAYFAFPIGVALVLLVKNKKWFILFIVLLVLSIKFLPVSVIERINMTTVNEEERVEGQAFDASTEARFKYTEKAIELFLKSPILGIGFRVFSEVVGRDTHNNYAKVLAECGIFGFVVYVLLYLMSIKVGWKLYKGSKDHFMKGLGLGFVGCVITNMVVNITHDNWSYLNLMGIYWVVLGLVVRNVIDIQQVKTGGQ
jgi:O-antigen ligase